MSRFTFLEDLRGRGISLSFLYEKIIVKPAELLTDETRQIIIANKNLLLLYLQVESACTGLSVSPIQVINDLLSIEDEQDIINNLIPAESLRLHIDVWVGMGKPYYSGKTT